MNTTIQIEKSMIPVSPLRHHLHLDTSDLIENFKAQLEKKTHEVVNKSFAYADLLSDTLFKQIIEKLEEYTKPYEKILKVEVNKVKSELKKPATSYLPRLLINAELGINTLLVGPAGCGKTIAAGQVAEALGRQFGHVCLTAGASETWLFGRQTPTGFVEGVFSQCYRNGGVFLADELDAADPNLLLAINTALANGSVYNPISGEIIERHPNFVFIGAANTVGKGGDGIYTGRNRLDAATLDRFVLVRVDYNPEVERMACPDEMLRIGLQSARKTLLEMKSQEVISTRTLERAHQQKQNGVSMKDILESITLGWPEELIKKCELDEPTFLKKKNGKR